APQASTATITKRTAATYGNEASVYGNVTYTADADNTITAAGTLNYVKDVTDMGADLKDGYFLTTDVTLPDIADLDYTKATVTVKSDKWTKGGIAPAGTFSLSKKAEDFITYIASDATKVEVTVDLDGDGELYTPTVYTITWDKVTDEAAAGKLYFAPQAAPKYTATTTLTEANKATNGGYLAISPAEAEETVQ
ncbi:MAG: hypothetical protein IJG16_02110, partial [Clostridia bacterium]|nr:hypothetical protein [Clostridia bacterium]